MQNVELRLVIVILKLVPWMNRLDIWIKNSNSSELDWISTSESWIIVKTKFFLWGSFRLECQKSLVYKEKMVGTEKGSLEYKQVSSSWSLSQLHLSFAWFLLFLMITFFYLF